MGRQDIYHGGRNADGEKDERIVHVLQLVFTDISRIHISKALIESFFLPYSISAKKPGIFPARKEAEAVIPD